MTNTAVLTEVQVERDPLRILSIAANLLPVEITDARRESKLRSLIAVVLVVVLAALGFWDYRARQSTDDAQATLTKTQARVESLHHAAAQYAPLNTAKNQGAAIGTQLTKLMAQDVAWYEVVPALRTTAESAGVSVTNLNAQLSPATDAAAATAGTITLLGVSPDKPRVAAYLQALAKIPGVANAALNSLNAQGGAFQYQIHLEFTAALYKGRFTPAGSNGGK